MRKALFTLLLTGLASTALAQVQLKATAFPAAVPAVERTGMKAPMQTPSAIDDKSQGKTFYANQLADESKLRSWITFTQYNTYSFTRLRNYPSAEQGYQNYGVHCGTWAGDKYVALFGQINNAGSSMEFKNFEKIASIDVATGEPQTIRELDDTITIWTFHADGVYGDSEYPNFYDMAYDPSTETLFALAQYQESADANAQSVLYTIDAETGEWAKVQELGAVYYNFTFDYDGTMYATQPKGDDTSVTGTYLVQFDSNFNATSQTEIKSWGESVVMGSFGSLTVDYTTGDLWWLCYKNSYGYYYDSLGKLALDGTWDQSGSFGTGNQIIGLYIPYLTADERGAAAQVSDLTATPDANGALKATLSWTNPTLTWDKKELTSLAEVLVYRKNAGAPKAESTEDIYKNSTLIGTLATVAVGETSQFTDENAQTGINTYYVVPCRVAGEKGVPDSIRCYMGLDRPGKISYVSAKRDGESITLTWSAPENGASNGYVNPDDFTYNIQRLPDSVVVATGLKALTFTDNTLKEMQKYSYLVSAVNSVGQGDPCQSDEVLAGQAPEPPYTFTATSYDESNLWESPYNSNYENFYFDYYGQRMKLLNYNTADNWLFAPGIRLKKGVTYRFTARYQGTRPEVTLTLDRSVGQTATSENRTEVGTSELACEYYDDANPVESVEDMFTPTEDGTYYWGLHVTGSTSYNVMYVYDVAVEAVLEKDIKAISLGGAKEAVAGTTNNATVSVRNSGSSDLAANSYTVSVLQVTNAGTEVVGTQIETPALKSGETATVNVNFQPTGEGEHDFAGLVSLEGDQVAANDTTAFVTYNVLPAGTTPWTGIVTDESSEWQSTYFPFSYVDPTDGSQCIYTADELDLPGKTGNYIARIGYEYDGNDLSDAITDIEVKIYMANVDKTSFSDNDWTDVSTMTLVYDGTCDIKPGKGNIMSFMLDSRFEYDPAKNLQICVVRHGDVETMFAALWRVYNNGGFTNRSIRYWSSSSDRWAEKEIATLYVGFTDTATGITDLTDTQSRINFSNGQLQLGEGIVRADVYDVSGKLVRSVNGTASVDLSQGLYIVRTQTASGQQTSQKLNIRK